MNPITHRHHIVTFHIRLILIAALVVELAEKVERHDGVEIHDHSEQPDRQHQLRETHKHMKESRTSHPERRRPAVGVEPVCRCA